MSHTEIKKKVQRGKIGKIACINKTDFLSPPPPLSVINKLS